MQGGEVFFKTKGMFLAFLVAVVLTPSLFGQSVNKERILHDYTWWDNFDLDWYQQQIPIFECPDKDIQTTYYYRWDLLTKHLTYGSANTGYLFTEFIDRPFWSGTYGAIACPAGHQLYEARWLRSPRIANDYTKYWFHTPGAQPRNYSTWIADSAWAINQVHPNRRLLEELLPELVENYEGWEQTHFVPSVGLFWQTGHDDGMEFNINSRQTQDILRGAPSYRPSFNSYMIADALAISRIAKTVGKAGVSAEYEAKAESLKSKMLELMWDPQRQFFFPVLKKDEERNGFELKALTRTYESGQYAGDQHGRELIGYVPWQFNLLKGDHRYDHAWKKLMDRDGFYADFGPSFVERNDPLFKITDHCCWWSGQSWPYATTQTLKALANLLQDGGTVLSDEDYLKTLQIYSKSHRKNGKPYLAEALHPDTGSFEGYDGYNHSQHYLHSGFIDLIVTGLVGLIPQDDGSLRIHPLAPAAWNYFALVDIPYRGHLLSVFWDREGKRYGNDAGFHVLLDGRTIHSSKSLEAIDLSDAINDVIEPEGLVKTPTNFAINNDGTYYPRMTATYTAKGSSISKLNDGNYWYLQHPPNRWTCEGSPNEEDSIEIDFGTERQIHSVKAYVLDDRKLVLDDRPITPSSIRVPKNIMLHYWKNETWVPIEIVKASESPVGHSPHSLHFKPLSFRKLKVTLKHSEGYRTGLTELEAWGDAVLPIERLPTREGNLAFNNGVDEFPRASCSHHDIYGGVPEAAIDGVTNFQPTPMNRWTSYGSSNESDWLQIDFGKKINFSRVEIAIYDDRGGVQAPESYDLVRWEDGNWKPIEILSRSPAEPAGGQWNTASFHTVEGSKLRIVFRNSGIARSGASEVTVWKE